MAIGDGVFEAVKVVDGVPFALDRHLARLHRSAERLGLPGVDLDGIRRLVARRLEQQRPALGRIRITLTRAPEAAAALQVVVSPMRPMPATAAVVTVPWPRNERGALAGHKTTAYAENLVALAFARERGASEAIFADTAGRLCEGTASNVFYVLDGELRTPSLATGCLPGVTRELVLEWYGAREVDEPITAIADASEVFLVSTTRDVQGVSGWDGRDLPAPGPVTEEVISSWRHRETELLMPPAVAPTPTMSAADP